MAYTIMGSPVDYFNRKQLRQAANALLLPYDLSTSNADLITAIKAA